MRKATISVIAIGALFALFLSFVSPTTADTLSPHQVMSSPGGVTGASGNPATGGGTCNGCHTGGDIPVVTISGPTTLAPGSTGTYTMVVEGGAFQIANPGSDGTSAGLNVSDNPVGSGTFGVPLGNPDVQVIGSEITHTTPKSIDAAGNVTFMFEWTAPATSGTYTLYGAGNSVNGNRSDPGDGRSGDAAGISTLEITVLEPTAVSLSQSSTTAPATIMFVIVLTFSVLALATLTRILSPRR